LNLNRLIKAGRFSLEEKFAAEILELRIDCGRLFHTRGSETQKPRPPALDERVRGSITFPLADERRLALELRELTGVRYDKISLEVFWAIIHQTASS